MNYTRRTWLTAIGALGAGAALTRCGGGNETLSPTSSPIDSSPLAQTQRSARTISAASSGAGRVIVIGGGMAGMAAAKYLRVWGGPGVQVTLLERNTSYTSNILSNLVLTGQRTLSSLVYSYAAAKQAYGFDVQQGDVTAIDPVGRKVTVAGRSTPLQYDRLIVAPGVVFDVLPGLESAEARNRVVHAWQAGPETTRLRNQLVAMPDGGTFVMTIPLAPYRCPPGPYERACVVADWLMRNKPKSKVIVLDANPWPTAERQTFETAFKGLFGSLLTYVPNVEIMSIDTTGARVVVHTVHQGDIFGDVVNAIPPQRAGKVVLDNGLANGGRWAPVNPATFESTVATGVHVIGDSCSAGVPKAGHIGNQEGKTAADAIVRAFRGLDPDPDVVINSACFSPITATTASWLTAVYRYDKSTNGYQMVNPPASEANGPTADGYQDMNTWFNTLMGETFA